MGNVAWQFIVGFEDFELVDISGYFVPGNAGSNDTCVEAQLHPETTNKRHRSLRCMGHIINFAAQV